MLCVQLIRVYCISVWACCVCSVCVCARCGNYCDLNAGSAGETGCLLINERSRWPRVGGELRAHSEPVRWSAQHRHLGHHKQDKPSGWHKPKTSGLCVCVLTCLCMCVCVRPSWKSTNGYTALYRISCDPLKGSSIYSRPLIRYVGHVSWERVLDIKLYT